MAGFTILIAPDLPPETLQRNFYKLLGLTAEFKGLDMPPTYAKGVGCMAAKLDSPTSIHPGIAHDEQSGSWLLATGTVVALDGDNRPDAVPERLLREYIENGAKALDGFDGHFALVIYNGQDKRVSVISDPISLYSIFYSRHDNQIIVSSSALAVAALTQSQPDVLAVEHFLRTGRLDADKTLWQDVKRLFAGTILRTARGGIELAEYWSPTLDQALTDLPFEEALEQSSAILTHSFARLLTREKSTWLDLTGGFDSRLAAIFAAKTKVPFSTYCMGPEDHEDVLLSRKVSGAMGWDYVHSQLPDAWEADQYAWFKTALGSGDGRANLLRFAVTLRGFDLRNQSIKTNVMGVGGENMRGYCWQIERGNMGRTSRLNMEALLDNIFSPAIPLDVMRSDRTEEVRQELSNFISQLTSKYADKPNTVKIDRFEIVRDSGHGGAYMSLVTKVGRSLAPLCFKAPVNFAFSLNYRWKYPRHHSFLRALMERENKRLADLETTTGGPAGPIRLTTVHRFWPLWKDVANQAVALGSKKVFGKAWRIWPRVQTKEYPLPAWRTTFHTYARSEGLLSYDSMVSKGLYKPDELDAYVKSVAIGQDQHSEFLDRVISVEMAMRAVGTRID